MVEMAAEVWGEVVAVVVAETVAAEMAVAVEVLGPYHAQI